jgi:hypothetical protein
MPQGYDLLSVTRVNGIAEVINANLAIPDSLRYLARTPVVDADEGEVMGSYEGRSVSAEIIPDDQRARVRQGGRVSLDTSAIPNLKDGSLITQAMMNLLRRINRGGGIPGDNGIISNYTRREVASLINGIRILQNRMIVGMLVDDFTYVKNGVKYKNISWGMPSTLKFAPSIPWLPANAATATPIGDLLLYKQQSAPTGETYNRYTCSTTQFTNIVNTTDFRTRAQAFTTLANSATTFQQISLNTQLATDLLKTLTGLVFEIDDSQWQDELNDGSTATYRYLAENVGSLSNSNDDNNAGTFDFANTTVNETEVGDVPGTSVVGGGFPAPQSGPVSYATITPDLNPPNITIWAVARGFPRKHRKTATARVTAWPA